MRWKNMEFIWFGENGRENGGEKVEFNPNSNRALGIRKEPIRPEGGWSHGVTPRRVVMATSSASKDPTMAIVYRRVADTRRKLTHTIRSPSWLLKHHNVAASGAESRKDLFLFFFVLLLFCCRLFHDSTRLDDFSSVFYRPLFYCGQVICAVSNWILSSQVHWKPALRPTSTQASRRRRRKPTYRKTNATTPIHVRLSSTNLSLAINQTKFHFHSSSFYHQFASLPIHHPKEWLQFFTVLLHVSSQISRDLRLAS